MWLPLGKAPGEVLACILKRDNKILGVSIRKMGFGYFLGKSLGRIPCSWHPSTSPVSNTASPAINLRITSQAHMTVL